MNTIPDSLIQTLKRARKVVVSTGAGVSAESGVPTFRGVDGIWRKMNPEVLASIDGFMRKPEIVWEWYQYRRSVMQKAQPNPGHYAIAEMEKLFPEMTLITQNTDGLHARAGSTRILELHGNITKNKCFSCGRQFTGEIDCDAPLPKCPCGGMIRPDVVWFGEMLPEATIQAAYLAAEESEVFFSVGTSAIVQPAASLPMVARRHGAYVIEINLEPTSHTPAVDLFLQGKSGEVLPKLLERMRSNR